jgi:DNA (cytosine-5)-methyltransferase 1
MTTTLKAIDFFCGAGGMTNGLLRAGIDVIMGVDNHLPCKNTYEHPANNTRPNGEPVKFLHRDINGLSADELLNIADLKRNDDHLVLIGCSPCQYWSVVNTDRNKAQQGKRLIDHFRDLVLDIQPGYIILENVPGLATRSMESGLDKFKEELRNCYSNYRFAEAVVPAMLYGVPQKRKRFILIGTRLQGQITLPPATQPEGLYPTGVLVRDFLGETNGFSPISAGHKDESSFQHTSSAMQEQNLKRIRLTDKNGGKRTAWKDNEELMINAYRHLAVNDFPDVYGRMSWDEPAPTITTKFNSFTNGRFGHPEEDRALSLREGATLQTFPKNYVFVGKIIEIARQIGNAVPPELAKRIGNHLLAHHSAAQKKLI